MLKRIGTYTLLTALGLLLGYLVFSKNDTQGKTTESLVAEKSGVWTCSMHPQVDGKENGKCPLCAMDLVFVQNEMADMSMNQFKMSESALALSNIQTVRVGSPEHHEATIHLSGLIATNRETDAIQTTLFDGRIDKLYPDYVGKKIVKGQEIGVIYSPELYLAQDKLITSASYRGTHEKLFNAARNTLGLWKMTDAQIEAVLESGKPMMNFPLYADVTGTVTEVLASEGKYYSQGDPLFKISDLRTVWAVLDSYESQLELLEVGQELEIRPKGLPNMVINTKIDFIEPVMDKERRTVSVRAVLDNRSGKLRPGTFIEAAVSAKLPEDIIRIPKSAVLWTGKRSVVYKQPMEGKPVFEMVEVELGRMTNGEYEVLDGLKYGDIVVAEGTFTVDAAAQLNGKKSMMSLEHAEGNNHGEEMDHHRHQNKDMPMTIGLEGNFGPFMDGYIDLKDALVATDANQAKEKAKALLVLFTNDNSILKNSQGDGFKHIKTHLQNIGRAKDITEQRYEFKYLSESLIALLPAISNSTNTLYVQHCDCADNFKGGSWVSYQENILNPYFGDAMLTCGRVEQVLAK
jgi:Cu(I)/Ag(I) efflux system membrane fusion protein